MATVVMDDVKLVVANSIENVVVLLGLKVSELFSFQSLLFPLLAPWQDPEHSAELSVLSFCLRPSSAKIGEPFPRSWEVTLHCYLLMLTSLCVCVCVLFCCVLLFTIIKFLSFGTGLRV